MCYLLGRWRGGEVYGFVDEMTWKGGRADGCISEKGHEEIDVWPFQLRR